MSSPKVEALLTPETAVWNLGTSALGRPLDALAIAPNGAAEIVPARPTKAPWPWVLVLAGAHGDEVEGVWLVEELRTRWSKHFPWKRVGAVLWARANPDGAALGQRWNGRNVDLNRNLPTRDWTPEVKNPRYPPGPSAASEPETGALVRLLDACAPRAVLSLHSFDKPQVNANGSDATGVRPWAEALAAVCGYPVTEDIGYPTPGSLGTFAGVERGIPTVTLEIERGLAREKVLALHVPTVEAALSHWEKL